MWKLDACDRFGPAATESDAFLSVTSFIPPSGTNATDVWSRVQEDRRIQSSALMQDAVVMTFVQAVLANALIPRDERQTALDRIHTGPVTPKQSGTTSSFWLKTPHLDLQNIQSGTLPSQSDVIIIGSGITATSVARTLLTSPNNTQLHVTILEARDICSGATGRNGGHCLETAEEYLELKKTWGQVAAQKIVRFRVKHLDTLVKVAEEYGIVDEAQVRKVQFLSAHFDEDSWNYSKASVEVFREEMPLEAEKMRLGLVENRDVIKEYRMPKAVGIVKGIAGALWPYKFVTSILSSLKKVYPDRLSIESHIPVMQTTRHKDLYHVSTSRGIIQAKHVVHCTNGYVAHLVPSLLGHVYPVRGQMSAQSAPHDLPNNSHKHSWLLNYGTGFDYLTQLPVVEGTCNGQMMLGGGFVNSPYGGIKELGCSRDDGLEVGAEEHLERALGKVFDIDEDKDRVEMMWTGIMGFSADGLPWVGEIPEQQTSDGTPDSGRQWVAAGFSGEGMVNTWLSGEALGRMILGFESGRGEDVKEELSQWFPEDMLITKQRMAASRIPTILPADNEEDEDESGTGSVSPSGGAMQAARL